MHVVVMEHVLPDCTPTRREVLEALDILHGAGYVHGDIKPANVYFVNGKTGLLDFDWAGRAGVVRYPDRIRQDPDMWVPGVKRRAFITREHDTGMVVHHFRF